jgi:hypothetical protein
LLFLPNIACFNNGEATNTNFIVFGLTRPGIKPTTYHTQGKHVNHYATDAVKKEYLKMIIDLQDMNYSSFLFSSHPMA